MRPMPRSGWCLTTVEWVWHYGRLSPYFSVLDLDVFIPACNQPWGADIWHGPFTEPQLEDFPDTTVCPECLEAHPLQDSSTLSPHFLHNSHTIGG